MRKILPILVVLLTFLQSIGQQARTRKVNVGIEQDVLPWLTGGYFAGAWVGEGHLRGRMITAKVNKPDFIVQKGFTNNRVTAYALLADYFLKDGWSGWWAGSGLVYWNNSIQTDKKEQTTTYKTWLLNGSIGYNFKLGKNFYLSPWCALHLRIGGDRHVGVDDQVFSPPFVNPEASIKLGAYF